MTEQILFKVTEPRLNSVKQSGYHWFRLSLLAGFGFWLIFLSPTSSELVRTLVTAGLLLVLWASWLYARRWSDIAVVIELTPRTLSYSLTPRQRLTCIQLADITKINYHHHLLILETAQGQAFNLHFPLKHRPQLEKLRQALAAVLPTIEQQAV